jgi:hypothetical protein
MMHGDTTARTRTNNTRTEIRMVGTFTTSSQVNRSGRTIIVFILFPGWIHHRTTGSIG